MFNFLIVWDSGIDNRVAKMIGNAAMECAGIFPNCNFHVYGTKRFSDTVSIDGLIANAKMRNGQVNAYDIVDGLERMDWKMLKKSTLSHDCVYESRFVSRWTAGKLLFWHSAAYYDSAERGALPSSAR